MRVAMVTGSYPPQPCGVGDYTERLVHELRSAGITVDVVTTEASDRKSEVSVQYTLKQWSLRNWICALRWMRSRQYDVMHIQYPARFYGYRPSLGFLAILAKIYLPRIPIVVTLHEFSITHLLRKLTSVALLSPASAVVLTADSERRVVAQWMPWLGSRVYVLTMATTIPEIPVDAKHRRELRQSYGIDDEDVVYVYFGLLHPNKGIEKLLQSFAAVHHRMPKTKLMMLSQFEPSINAYHAGLQADVAALDIGGSVVWAGYLDNVAVSEHLASADVGLFPFQDGVTLRRLSFMTGMSHGLPILTTSGHAGVEELGLRDGENVLLVPADALPEAFAVRLLALANDPALRARVAAGAREWAAPFQWETIFQKLLPIYERIAAQGNKARHVDG
jgi:polysaccharide biosynthesis protein PslF